MLRPLELGSYRWLRDTPQILGALINRRNKHWTALVKHDNAVWYVDSCDTPQLLDEDAFIGCLLTYSNMYPLASHDYDL